jgi:hypothetical protein
MTQGHPTEPANEDTLRQATEAEDAGKESLGSAATNAPPAPGPLVDQFLKWVSGNGPFPRRGRPAQRR